MPNKFKSIIKPFVMLIKQSIGAVAEMNRVEKLMKENEFFKINSGGIRCGKSQKIRELKGIV